MRIGQLNETIVLRCIATYVILYVVFFGSTIQADEESDELSIYSPRLNYLERQRNPSEDWRLGKSVLQYWVRSWKAYTNRDYEGAVKKLKPLLDKELTPDQIDEVKYAMSFNYRALANNAYYENDMKARIRHLKAAVDLQPYPPQVAIDNFHIAQAYRRLGNWKQCAEYGERAFTVKLRWIQFVSMRSLIIAECHLKDDNIDRAKYWVTVARKMEGEKEKPIHPAQQWAVDAVESAAGAQKTTE